MNFPLLLLCLAALIIGYLIGSIPFGYIVGKAYGIDITKEGSGSTGTTNALRLLGKKAAILVLLGDFLKGFIAPYLCLWVWNFFIKNFYVAELTDFPFNLLYIFDPGTSITSIHSIPLVLGSIGALIGHVKSCWIGFKGGKAVATGVGTLFALDWRVGLITAIIWALTVYISKYSSLGALIAVPLSPVFMLYFKFLIFPDAYSGSGFVGRDPEEGSIVYVIYCILGAAYIIYKHQANIQRLLSGTEPKVGQKKAEKETETDKT